MAQPSMPGQLKTIVLAIETLDPEDVPELVERVSTSVTDDDATVLLCDVASLADADMGTVDALARLALRARRLGCAISLRDPSSALRELLVLAGLCEVLPCPLESGVEVVGEAEHRKEPLGVEEEGDARDPPVP